jgi:hypothetical protein
MADAFDYLESRTDADELIAEFGQAVALRRATDSGPAWEPTQTTTDYATLAVILDYTAQQRAASNQQAGSADNVLMTDRRALVAAGPLVDAGVTNITPPDALVVGGVAVPIVRAVTLAPAGTVVMFDCQLRF